MEIPDCDYCILYARKPPEVQVAVGLMIRCERSPQRRLNFESLL